MNSIPKSKVSRLLKETRHLKDGDRKTCRPLVTLFAIPKPFDDPHIAVIQKNAIRSWAHLSPHVEVILFCNKEHSCEVAHQEIESLECVQVLPIRVNDRGTPILSDAFEKAHRFGSGQLLMYSNCDLIFGDTLLSLIERLSSWANDETSSLVKDFLAIGQRTDLKVDTSVNMSCQDAVSELFQRANKEGKLDSVVCKDYFLFPKTLLTDIPDFLVGRGNWDNWIVWHAKQANVPVIDLTAQLAVIHQNHDYKHVPGGRKQVYISGEEARQNQTLSGGRRLVSGSTATWELTENTLKKRRFPVLKMLRDTPKFLRLLRNITFLG